MQNTSKKIDFGKFPIINGKKLPTKTLGPELFGKIALELMKEIKYSKQEAPAPSGKISLRRSPVEVPFVFR